MTASGTHLRSVARVDKDCSNTSGFSFVADERPQLRKAPAVQSTTLFLSPFHAVANIGQIFHDDGSTRQNRINDAAGKNMIAIATKTSLLATEDLQSTFGRFGPFGLTLPFLPKDASFDIFPTSFAKKFPFAGDCRSVDAKINTNCHRVLNNNGGRRFNDNMQKESSISVNKIGRANIACNSQKEHGGKMKRNGHFSRCRRKPNGCSLPIHFKSVDVVSRRASRRMRAERFTPLFSSRECGLDGFCGFDTSLNMEITHKIGKRIFESSVSQMMQPNAVFFIGFPCGIANSVEGNGKLPRCFEQR